MISTLKSRPSQASLQVTNFHETQLAPMTGLRNWVKGTFLPVEFMDALETGLASPRSITACVT